MKKTFVLMLMLVLFGSMTAVQQPAAAEIDIVYGELLSQSQRFYLYAGEPLETPYSIPAPANLGRQAPTADIQVTYIGSWPTEARNAFEYATTIWESVIESPVPITVEAEFGQLPPNVLGGAGPNGFRANFTNAPVPDTWYPLGIVNSRAGGDLDPATADIGATFSNQIDWYYGIDANPPNNQFDFVAVVLHEIGHGLGFAGSMRVSNGVGTWGLSNGFNTYPIIYDRYTQNGSGQVLLTSFNNNSPELAGQLTSNNIFFASPNAISDNGGQPAGLFAPSIWIQGSSYSHLDESFNGTNNALMTHAISPGLAIHTPGPVTLAMFQDMGWQIVAPAPQEPTLNSLGKVLLEVNESRDNAVDLWAYASDGQSADNALTFQLIGQTDPNAGATIDSNRYVDINPTAGWLGTSTITIRVTDPDNNTAEATLTIESIENVINGYLPLIQSQ